VRRVGILGAGRQAIETAGYLNAGGDEIAWFFEEAPPDYERDLAQYGAPIVRSLDATAGCDVTAVTAIGDPTVRQKLASLWSGRPFAQAVSSHAWLADDAELGFDCTVAPLAAINRKVSIEDHVLVNVGAIVCHDVRVGRFSTLSPRCVIGGGCVLGEQVFIGIGATVVDHITIGSGARIAAGAVVVRDVASGTTVMGVPARPRGDLT
jgi:sugar O-acyltransferase (sialic acid O-acetyltransferase NeuD family)